MTTRAANQTPEPDTKPDAIEAKPSSKVDWGRIGVYITAVSVLGAGCTALINISNRFDRQEQASILTNTRLVAVEVAKEKVAVLETNQSQQDKAVQEIKTDIREIKTDIKELLKRK